MITPDPREAPPVKWGVIGPGWIADRFVADCQQHTAQQIVAVGSRSSQRAAEFADRHGIAASYASYEELVTDPNVEAVYVASPHSEHAAHALMAIAAGKHVLVEKAFTRNAAEAQRVIDAARAANVFCMEAMWTRFLPHAVAVRELLASGAIGDIVHVWADHGQYFDFDAQHRLFNPDLAGGALLDLGIYPISFVYDVLGAPREVSASGELTSTGVDGQACATFTYAGKVRAQISTTLWAQTPTGVIISGTEGRIDIPDGAYGPAPFTWTRRDGLRVNYERTVPPNVAYGLHYQVAEAARRIAAGELESPILPHAQTIDILRTIDTIRDQIGVVYPGESAAGVLQ